MMICWISTAGRLFYAALIGESMITVDKGFLNLFFNMAANVVSAIIVPSPIVEKGMYGMSSSVRQECHTWMMMQKRSK
jgi:hypothetical protein